MRLLFVIAITKGHSMKIIPGILILLLSFNLMAAPAGERLAFVLGCINCHHQTPKQLINAPSLVIVQPYTLDELRILLKTGKTRDGRDLLASSSLMGIVATEQFIYMSDEEIQAVYDFLKNDWTAEKGLAEEAKIPLLYQANLPQ
ncbi:MAG: hypothetical protein HW386_1634 [Gammaproteobacteria bacterium]|nr:hypothetical protein [Gammaproteobacteria bacterium]